MAEPSSLTSNELNLLVFRYLTESGFLHSAFVFGYEAGVDKMNIDGSLIPPGALITIVQKGLQYIELEANLNCNDKDEDNEFSLLQPIDLIMKDVTELQRIIREKKENLHKERDPEKQMNVKGPKKWQKSRTKRVLIKKFAQERDKKEQQKNIEEKLIGKSAAEVELRCDKKL